MFVDLFFAGMLFLLPIAFMALTAGFVGASIRDYKRTFGNRVQFVMQSIVLVVVHLSATIISSALAVTQMMEALK
jgi:hypothetical protein